MLVFDEVKVVSRLMWNSRNQQIIGLAMSPEDMSSLHDIYMAYDEDTKTEQTTYVLQFLWRDLTSKFDIVGPYFTSSGSVKTKFTVTCVFETCFSCMGLKPWVSCVMGLPQTSPLSSAPQLVKLVPMVVTPARVVIQFQHHALKIHSILQTSSTGLYA